MHNIKGKKILLSAYACEPNMGSEHEIGWSWILNLSKLGFQIEVITRKSNKKLIIKELKKTNLNVKFHFYDIESLFFLKYYFSKWSYLYYFFWQLGIFFKFKNYIKKSNFYSVHHVTISTLRFPSFLSFCHNNFILGPVGGTEIIPSRIIYKFPLKDIIKEYLRNLSNLYIKYSPLLNLSLYKTKKIILSKKKDLEFISKIHRQKVKFNLTIGISKNKTKIIKTNKNFFKNTNILFVGRLESHKGIRILLNTFKILNLKNKRFKFTILGSGPLKKYINNYLYRNNLEKVNFMNKKVQFNEMYKIYKNNHLFIFPSLREVGGMVLLESMNFGLVPIVLDNGGPGYIVNKKSGLKINFLNKSEQQISNEIANKVIKLFNDIKNYRIKSVNAKKRSEEFLWIDKIKKIYDL